MKYTCGIITLSDKGACGRRQDLSGPLIEEMLLNDGRYQIMTRLLLSDDRKMLERTLIKLSDKDNLNLILTTGGTGFSPRDNAPEATLSVMTRNAPGISEFMRMKSAQITPKAMLSRGASVIRGKTLIINLPGSPKAAKENLEFILPALPHGLDIMLGLDGECAGR